MLHHGSLRVLLYPVNSILLQVGIVDFHTDARESRTCGQILGSPERRLISFADVFRRHLLSNECSARVHAAGARDGMVNWPRYFDSARLLGLRGFGHCRVGSLV